MDKTFETYLDTIDKHLKPLPTSERVDIVKEIKSSILEMKQSNLSTEQILDKLGSPKEMANAYLENLISSNNGFNYKKYLAVIAFYSSIGFSGLFVIPTLAIVAPVFIFCGAISPVFGVIKLLGYLLHFNVSFVIFQFGSVELHPILGFLFSIITGIILYKLGRGSWNLLLKYIHRVSQKKKDLSL